jgi:DNA-binding response OmpR family regulator
MQEQKHILVVDDEADLIELVSYNLRKEGFTVDSASDGEKALKKIRKGTYSLVILDLMLPGIQGIELCRIIRNDLKTVNCPSLCHSKGEEVDRIIGLEMGADDYMSKPFSPKELVARVALFSEDQWKNLQPKRY